MKLTKRILAAVTAASCVFCINFAGWERTLIVNAADYSDPFKYGDYLNYRQIDEDEDGIYDYIEISSCDESAVSVEIPSEIDGLPVTSVGEWSFSDCNSLTSVEIPDGVTSIGYDAFHNCSSLESINIPDSVTSIGIGAFRYCSNLKSITIGGSVTSIEAYAFYLCENLDNITIPDGVTSIGIGAFSCCSSLTNINVSENNKNYISVDGALFNKDKTELIAFPAKSEITEYIIPDSVTIIGDLAFADCDSLTSITIENPKCEIFDGPFTIYNEIDENYNAYFNGTIYGYKDSTAQAYAEKYGYNFKLIDEIPDVTEPTEPTEPTESVVTTSVTTTASVETSATNITATELSDYLSYKKVDEDEDGIYDYIEISSCDESAVSVEIPSEIDGLTVKSIGDSAFSGCSSLISMEIPDSITSIGDCAFLNCSSLTNINVSENNKDYSSIDGILFNKDKTELIQYPQSSEIIEYIIPDSVTSIKNMAFFDCSSLASVTIPESVISIEFATFRGCSSLESITIPDSVTNIGNWAFRDCSSLTSIEIPNNVTSIGNSAFEGCSSLTSINVSENNKDYSSIDGILFNKDKTELIKYPESKEITEYIVPDSVIYIDSLAFSGSSSLTSINVSENNKDYSSIDGILFNKDKTLLIRYPQSSEITEYIVPNSVICIEDDAFSDCSSLTSVTILDSVTVIRYGAFFGCSSLESITIPDGVSTIDNSTFCNCTNLESITIENPKCEIFDALLTICNGRDDQTGDYYFNGTIYGYKDSTAQAYAEKYKRKFAEINNAEVDGNSNGDGVLNVRDCAFIASALAKGNGDSLPMSSDFNKDGKVNVRDAAAIASYLAKGGK